MTIELREQLPSPDDFLRLFRTVGWTTDAGGDRLIRAIGSSWHAVCAFDGDRLVAMGRTISDGAIHALIVDVIVDPDYQGQGLGREVMRQLISRCDRAGIEMTQLFAARGKAAFYERLGFAARAAEAPGMELQRG
jgi:GNAT superfamily N-acetyltransferase